MATNILSFYLQPETKLSGEAGEGLQPLRLPVLASREFGRVSTSTKTLSYATPRLALPRLSAVILGIIMNRLFLISHSQSRTACRSGSSTTPSFFLVQDPLSHTTGKEAGGLST